VPYKIWKTVPAVPTVQMLPGWPGWTMAVTLPVRVVVGRLLPVLVGVAGMLLVGVLLGVPLRVGVKLPVVVRDTMPAAAKVEVLVIDCVRVLLEVGGNWSFASYLHVRVYGPVISFTPPTSTYKLRACTLR